jgi:DNA repair exonuclease SbcCD ATPase subunit
LKGKGGGKLIYEGVNRAEIKYARNTHKRRVTNLNVNSVSNSSILWEEYIKKLKEQGRETAAEGINLKTASQRQDIVPEALLAELEELQSDPDALKARAAEMAAQVSAAAEEYVDARGDILKEFAADLETVASDGDLSAIREKLPRREPSGGPSGMSGAASVSASSLQAMLAEEEDDETSVSNIDRIKELLSELQELIAGMSDETEDAEASKSNLDLAPDRLLAELEALEGDTEKLNARAAEMAEQLSASAENRSDRFSSVLKELASDLAAVSESGDLSVIREKLDRGRSGRLGSAQDASISPAAIFSKYQSLRESAGEASSSLTNVLDDTEEEDDDQVSIEDVIESVRSNLSNRLSELYSQSRITSSSMSMSA